MVNTATVVRLCPNAPDHPIPSLRLNFFIWKKGFGLFDFLSRTYFVQGTTFWYSICMSFELYSIFYVSYEQESSDIKSFISFSYCKSDITYIVMNLSCIKSCCSTAATISNNYLSLILLHFGINRLNWKWNFIIRTSCNRYKIISKFRYVQHIFNQKLIIMNGRNSRSRWEAILKTLTAKNSLRRFFQLVY